jgi:hypothetical protein
MNFSKEGHFIQSAHIGLIFSHSQILSSAGIKIYHTFKRFAALDIIRKKEYTDIGGIFINYRKIYRELDLLLVDPNNSYQENLLPTYYPSLIFKLDYEDQS